ncbi:tetraspanin-18-like [Thamnophis elegans]|uniref:tetraspanin-18-like n=1 Tax=Thamnophis elegans TaxID=35005 RepID=UPI0013780C7B|nr:tetraspanin-18-like [Thamnophis elegans]
MVALHDIGSLCLIIVAIWAIFDPKRILDIHPNYFLKIAVSIILLMGLLVAWLSYLGIYATVAEDIQWLKTLVILILVISIVKLLIIILLYFFAAKIRDKYLINQLAQKYEGDDGTNVYSKALNGFMIMFQCCGILGSGDFKDAERFKEKQPHDSWPKACCTRAKSPEPEEILDVKLCQQGKSGYVNNLGCSKKMGYFFEWYTWTLVGFCLGMLAAEQHGPVMVMCLCVMYTHHLKILMDVQVKFNGRLDISEEVKIELKVVNESQ